METTVHKKENGYFIYVEGYVLSYLQEKAQEGAVCFFGRHAGQRYEIYGAGDREEIAAFREYARLPELSCSMCDGKPVFTLKQGGRSYEIAEYGVFYQENEAMQQYLLECQRETGEKKTEKRVEQLPQASREKTGQRQGWFSVQLAALFLFLVAIVITSADNYDKLLQLGKSARDVLFMVENQSTQQTADTRETADAVTITVEAEDDEERTVNAGEVIVEQTASDTAAAEGMDEQALSEKDSQQETESGQPETKTAQPETASASETESSQPETASAPETESSQSETVSVPEPGTVPSEAASASEAAETAEEQEEMNEGEGNVEALSRNLTRYYEVEKGDTLYTICREIYGDTAKVREICDLNQIADPDDIRYGQKIVLP